VRAIKAALDNPSRGRLLIWIAGGLIAFGMGCGDSTAPPAPVATVAIAPSTGVDLVPGGTDVLQAIPKDASGNSLTNRIAEWSSSDQSKVTVAAGVVTGVALGAATITATVEGHAASMEVKVKEGVVATAAAGASFTGQDSVVALSIPPGALTQTRNITVEPAQSSPPNDRLVPGTAFDFGPNGTTFAQPVNVTIKYDPSKLTGGSPESGLQLYEVIGSSWRVVAGSSVNTATQTVTGSVSHFTVYGVLMQPRVETIAINRDTTVQVRTTVQFSATLRDNEQQPLTRPVSWTSSSPSIVSVDGNGLATANLPGRSTVTATSEGKSTTASVTVVPGPASVLSIMAGDGQSAVAGSAVATRPAVTVSDAFGNGIAGFAVAFAVASGGGAITAGAATTNASGVATVGSWTLGTAAGPNTLTASGAGLTPASVTFTASGGAGAPAKVVAQAGNNQTATAGGPVATAPSVKVTDANGNAISGFTVVFAPGAGSGSVTVGTAVTNSSGIAAVGSWTLGTTPGPQSLTATASGLSGSPVTFAATAVAPVPARVVLNGGDGQTASAGSPVAVAPVVRVVDAAGIGVPGFTVAFAVTGGGGSVTGGEVLTNVNGFASVGSWVMGPTPGTNALTATAGSLQGSPVTFTATAVAAAPVAMAIVAGNGQSATVGSSVSALPAVKVSDAFGNDISGFVVTFSVTSGGGSVTGAAAATNSAGIATVGSWTLGTAAGPNALTASGPGLTPASLTFTAMGLAGAPASVVANGGNDQTAMAGSSVTTGPSVKVTDANGNPLSGFTVTFAVTGGGGSVTGGSAVTNANGVATVGSWVMGTAAGPNTLAATAGSLQGSPVTFTATAVAATPAAIVIVAGDGQSAAAGSAVPTAPAVKVSDAFGNAVSGFVVTFAVASGGGSISGAAATTNSSGVATVGSWTLGPTAGLNTLTATGPGLTPSSVTFTATASAPPAVAMAISAGNQQSANAGTDVPIKPAVIVTDAQGRGVPGIAVTFAVTSGGGSITGGNAVTNSSGIATVGSWTLGIGSNSLSATAPGLAGSPITFVATGVPFIQLVTFGDSNTDRGYQGTDPTIMASSYVSNDTPRLGPNDPNSIFQLAGKIEATWRLNRPETIKAVNHGIVSTRTGTGRTDATSPNALEVVNGFTRFEGEVLGLGYPWSGGESTNSAFPNGPILRVQAFKPRASDFVYVSLGTNDLGTNVNADSIAANLSRLVDMWVGAGLAPNHFIITTLPPRDAATSTYVLGANVTIRGLATQRGLRLIDLGAYTSNADGTWKSATLHIDGDLFHYSEAVRTWLAAAVFDIINAP
jgi:adhesin/invasin